MKRLLALFLVFGALVSLAVAQDYKGKGRVVGTVTDDQGQPIPGVKVKLFSHLAKQGFEVETDAEGQWIAAWIRGGAWDIDFEKIGFMPKKIAVEIQQYGRNPDIKTVLQKAEGLILTDELKTALTEGNNLFDQGMYTEAIAAFEKILTDYPDVYVIAKNIGNSYFQMEDYDKAEEYYLKVLEKDPQNQDAMLLIGNCYANRGDSDKALEWYNQIEFEKISDPIVLYNIGTNYYNLGQYEDAVRFYRRSVEIKEDFTDGLYQLGLANLTLTNFKDSIAAFEQYLKFDPDSGRAEQVKQFVEFLKTKIE